MKTEIYRSAGVLGRELAYTFSVGVPASEFYDVITVEIPDMYVHGENEAGELLLKFPDSEFVYVLAHVLRGYGVPYLEYVDDREQLTRIVLKTM